MRYADPLGVQLGIESVAGGRFRALKGAVRVGITPNNLRRNPSQSYFGSSAAAAEAHRNTGEGIDLEYLAA